MLEDSESDLVFAYFDLSQVLEMIDEGEITDAITVAALQRVARTMASDNYAGESS